MSASFRPALGISRYEFKRMFNKCRPPTGWSNIIAVANSGGPDSTCLLFLLHQYLTDLVHQEGKSPRLISISVDHDLQPSSSSMAESCAKFARSLPGVEHMTTKIPWSTPPFPERPGQGEENTARMARFDMLFRSLNSVPAAKGGPANVIALGHHADDQVETALMRLGMGSTELGAAGMRPCRRWGMGIQDVDGLGWAGLDGMDKWIIRPLLDVTKDKILATCEENELDYVTDESNFQPHITVRNAIRKLLSSDKTLDDVESVCPEPLPPAIKEQLSHINSAVSSFKSFSVDLNSGSERLRGLVKHLMTQLDDIDGQVDRLLTRCLIPSPPGTLLLSLRGLHSENDDLIRIALVLRVMRCISYYPWGSIRADGNRKKKMREQVLGKLWSSDPLKYGKGLFVAGAGVLWTPVLAKGKKFKTPDWLAKTGLEKGEAAAWLVSRQHPMNKRQMDQMKISDPLHMDVTETLKQKLEDMSNGSNPPATDFLYDCRFLVRFHTSKMPLWVYNGLRNPEKQARISIVPNTRWYRPQIILENGGESHVLHSDVAERWELLAFSRPSQTPSLNPDGEYRDRANKGVVSEWIEVEWVRPLTNI